MSDRRYTQDHEWIDADGEIGTVGITDYAQDQMGDVVFVELPDSGKALTRGGEAAVVESVKAASEVYSPVSGEVVESNPALSDNPGLVNVSAEYEGWFFKIKITKAEELNNMMDKEAYSKFIEETS